MGTSTRSLRAGWALVAAGILWAVAIVIEYTYGLKPPNSGMLYAFDQGMFFVAQLGYVTGILGLFWARAAGDGWFGKLSLGLFAGGWIVLVVAQPLAWVTGNNNLPLFPIGGLAAMLGGLLAGFAVLFAGRWSGWRRFTILVYSLYYLLVLLGPLFLAHQHLTLVTEALWGLAWLPIGFALITQARRVGSGTPPRQRSDVMAGAR